MEQVRSGIRRGDPEKPDQPDARILELVVASGRSFRQVNGERHYLWRVVDHEGEVLDYFVSKRRDRNAALKFLRKLMKRFGQPQVIVTDKLRSYGAAMKVIGSAERQETGRWLNSRIENSHQPF